MKEQNNFLGISNEYSKLENSEIAILSVPFELTASYQKGTRLGPNAILTASKHLELYDVETNSEIYKRGIFTAPPLIYNNSKKMITDLEKQVDFFLKKNKFVVTLGGEHSISLPCIKAHLKHFGKLSILQLDAHADLEPALDGDPYSHGSVMARVKELDGIDDIVAVGIRSMSDNEAKAFDKTKTFFSHDIHTTNNWIDKVIDSLQDPVYVTFDLDVFDPSLLPATGTPEPGGLFWHQIFELLKKLTQRKKIVGFDIVELMPIKGLVSSDFIAAKAVYKLLSYIKKGLK